MKKLLLSLSVIFGVLTSTAQDLNVASFNIRLDTSKDYKQGDGWPQRCPQVCRIILSRDFDVFGAQEVKKKQLDYMVEKLPDYDYIGEGRDGGDKGEFCPVEAAPFAKTKID